MHVCPTAEQNWKINKHILKRFNLIDYFSPWRLAYCANITVDYDSHGGSGGDAFSFETDSANGDITEIKTWARSDTEYIVG